MKPPVVKFCVGIDEAGRGPLAGPVAVGVVVVPVGFDWARYLPAVDDSKKLSSETRGAIFSLAKKLRHARLLNFTVAMVGNSVIDRVGITTAIHIAMARSLDQLQLNPSSVTLRLDGALKAPLIYDQATIIGGDSIYPEIGLASICAKEMRDAYMQRADRRWPQYGFARHMGYGTKEHRANIARYGRCPIHRTTYCKNIKMG